MYQSVFGEAKINWAYYWRKAEKGYFPLDAELNLPYRLYSHLLDKWIQGSIVEMPYDKSLSSGASDRRTETDPHQTRTLSFADKSTEQGYYLYRVDRSGSRWSAVGIQAVLNLRAVMKNGDWDDYWNYYMAAERNRFYGNLSSQDSTNRSAAA